MNTGAVDNSATATGTPPTGPPVTTPPSTTSTPTDQTSSISLVKTADKTTLVAGQTITYTFTATNTGNTTLSNVKIAEDAFSGSGSMSGLTCTPAKPTTLAPGATLVCTATYVVKQADVDAGTITNDADVVGTPPKGPNVTDTDEVTVPGTSTPAIKLVKTADKTTLVAGQTITYTFTATNTGNTSLSNVKISEGAFSGSGSMSGLTCTPTQPATLAPNDTLVCTATYVVTQNDVDAGSITNDADVVGTPPSGPKVTDTDEVKVPGNSAPALGLVKTVSSVTDVNNNGLNDVGDKINYAFKVTNNGNVSLNPVVIADNLLAANGITVTCPAGPLAPGASVTCTADAGYVITQADVDAGAVSNTATATGTPPTGPPTTSPPSSTTTPTAQKPAIELVKTADKTTLVAGQTITYTFTATNTGNTSLSNVTISEGAFSGSGSMSGLTCTPTQPATLAPKDTLVCTATYVVTQKDVDAGSITNDADVVGTPPSGPKVTDTDEVKVPGDRTRA